MFFSRHQQPQETLREYSYELIKLIDRIKLKCPKAVHDRNKWLCDQFAENVRDPSLKKELRRILRDNWDTNFIALREEAVRWYDEDLQPDGRIRGGLSEVSVEIPQGTGDAEMKRASADTNSCMSELIKTMQQQQDQINELVQSVKALSAPVHRHSQEGTGILCYNCRKRGHISRNCPEPSRKAAQKTPGTADVNSESQVNTMHPSL